jgi:[ribosomal protein S18]-alanine N-acetyltransferase
LNHAEYRFSPIRADNYHACFTLHNQVQYSPWSVGIFTDCLTKPYFAYSMHAANTLLGYYVAMQVLEEVTLMDLAVDPAQQGKGYGKRLLEHFINQCEQRSATEAWLEVRESNKRAIALYHNAYFNVIEERKNYYLKPGGTESAIIMQCMIMP